jgi:uncharacterized protein
MGPADMPTFWTTYLASENADETAAKIKAAGGQLLTDPMDVMNAWDSPYGRMAVVRDDQGAAFALMSVSEEHEG